MQHSLARLLAIFLALQPWAFGMFALPRSKSNTSSSLSSPAQDQAVLENARVALQVQSSSSDMGIAPKTTASLEIPVFYLVSSLPIPSTGTPRYDLLARFSRWNE